MPLIIGRNTLKSNKKKEEETLDIQHNSFHDEDENEMKNRKILKAMRRNSHFRHLTWNVGNSKKNGLQRLEIEEGNRGVTVCNKDEI